MKRLTDRQWAILDHALAALLGSEETDQAHPCHGYDCVADVTPEEVDELREAIMDNDHTIMLKGG